MRKKPVANGFPLNDSTRGDIKVDRDGFVRCRVCGCTDREPCEPPCSWTAHETDLCSGCLQTIEALLEWQEGAHRANMSALLRELSARSTAVPARRSA